VKGQIFTYGLTYVGAVVALFYPFVGVLIYISFAILEPPGLWYWSVPIGNYARIVAIAMLIGWVIKGGGDWRLGRSQAVLLSLVAYLLWATISLGMHSAPDWSWGFVVELTKVVLPFMAGLTLITSVRQLKQLAWTIALSQGYLAYEMNLRYYEGFYSRFREVSHAGLDNNSVAIAMATGVGFALFLGLREKVLWRKALAFLACVLMAHVIMFSMSRGGMLALCVVGVVSMFLVPKREFSLLLFIAVVILGFRLAGEGIRTRFSTVFVDAEQRDQSAQGRLDMWINCLDVMRRYPLLGCGPNQWRNIAPEYGHAKGKEAHTLWLQTGAELGIPGMAFLVSFYGLCIWRLWGLTRPYARPPDPWLTDGGRMVVAALAGFAVSAQFVSLEGLEIPYYVTLFGAGVLKVNSLLAAQNTLGPVNQQALPQPAPGTQGTPTA